MAESQDLSYQAGELKGHAQVKKDEMVDKASDAAQPAKEGCQQGQEKASNLMQQTGEQMKSMAQGAADAVQNTLGVGENKNS